jgi:uncharacterized protein (TIGR03437 family)
MAAVAGLAIFLALAAPAQVVTGMAVASIDSGSLAGDRFPVIFSYDAAPIAVQGDVFLTLRSFDFVLRGTTFSRADIYQGGQAVFHNGKLTNVTAAFLPTSLPNPPVNIIAFGFGGDGVIGYVDAQGKSGGGSFTFSTVTAAVNAASFAIDQPLVPGALASIFGAAMIAPGGENAVAVTVGGQTSPLLLYISPSQINFQLPKSLPAGTADVVVTSNGVAFAPARMAVQPSAPAVFTTQFGTGQASAVNLDGTLADIAHPVKPGDYLMIFVTGLGTETSPALFIGGASAQVTYAGPAPQFPGVDQINAVVPATPAGIVPLQIQTAAGLTSDKVTIAVSGR